MKCRVMAKQLTEANQKGLIKQKSPSKYDSTTRFSTIVIGYYNETMAYKKIVKKTFHSKVLCA